MRAETRTREERVCKETGRWFGQYWKQGRNDELLDAPYLLDCYAAFAIQLCVCDSVSIEYSFARRWESWDDLPMSTMDGNPDQLP